MAHCPNCSPQPRNEQHTIDRLQNTVEPLLYTRNFMLAKYFKMECECMRCQEFISSIPNMERPREDLRTPKHHTPTSPFLLPILILLLLIVQKTYILRCSTVIQNWRSNTSQLPRLSRTYVIPGFLTCNLSINLGFCLSLTHIKSL